MCVMGDVGGDGGDGLEGVGGGVLFLFCERGG